MDVPNPLTPIRFYLALATTAILVIAFVWGNSYYEGLKRDAAVGELRGTKIETTSGLIGDGQVAAADGAKVEVVLRDARSNFTEELNKAKANEPDTADRAVHVVPVSVRSAARARRLARERSANAASERAARNETSDAAER